MDEQSQVRFACLNCQEVLPNFDAYFCQKCAENLGFNLGPEFSHAVRSAIWSFGMLGMEVATSTPNKGQSEPNSERLAVSIPPAARYQNARKFMYLFELLERVRHLDGAVVECGVGAGESLLHLCAILADRQPHRAIYGFDSFEGFPEPAPEDASPRNAEKGDIWSGKQVGMAMLKILHDSFRVYGIPIEWSSSHLYIIRGYFEKTLPEYMGGDIAFLHLDCDLYQSYKTALEHLFPKVVKGGIIAVDEYNGTLERLMFPGAKKAIDEYMADKLVELVRDPYMGKCYFIKN